MVTGSSRQGSGGVIQSLLTGLAFLVAGVIDPVRRLRPLAENVASRWRPGTATLLLADTTIRRSGPARVAAGPPASCGPEFSRRTSQLHSGSGAERESTGSEPA